MVLPHVIRQNRAALRTAIRVLAEQMDQHPAQETESRAKLIVEAEAALEDADASNPTIWTMRVRCYSQLMAVLHAANGEAVSYPSTQTRRRAAALLGITPHKLHAVSSTWRAEPAVRPATVPCALLHTPATSATTHATQRG